MSMGQQQSRLYGLAERVSAERRERGWTVEDAVGRVSDPDVSVNWYRTIERSRSGLHPEDTARLAEIFEVEETEILRWAGFGVAP